MNKSKLIDLLKNIETEQWSRLQLFLQSPYFFNADRNPHVFQLFSYLKAAYPFEQESELHRERVYEILFPGQPFSFTRLSKLMVRLLKLLRLFIAYESTNLQADDFQRDLLLARYYREHQDAHAFWPLIKRLESEQNKQPLRGQPYYLKQFQIEQEKMEFSSQYNRQKGDLNLPATIRSLDTYYLLCRLEYSCAYLNQTCSDHSILTDTLQGLRASLPTVFEKEASEQAPLIRIYHLVLSLLAEYEEAVFLTFQKTLAQHAATLPFPQLQALQAIHRSFFIKRFNRGATQSWDQLFQLYKTHLQAGYLYYEGALMAANFRHLVVMGLKMGAFKWVRQFLESHQDKIRGTHQPDLIYAFNKADYYFAIRAYPQALDCLPDGLDDLYQKIDARRLELKIAYEQESVLLDARIDTFKMLISRLSKKLLPPIPREGNLNFVNMLKQIIHPNTFRNPKRITKLIVKTQSKKIIAEKEWLLDKLERLNQTTSHRLIQG